MEKMSSDLHVKKMEHVVFQMYLKKKNYTSLLSSMTTTRSLLVKRSGLNEHFCYFLFNTFPFYQVPLDIIYGAKIVKTSHSELKMVQNCKNS